MRQVLLRYSASQGGNDGSGSPPGELATAFAQRGWHIDASFVDSASAELVLVVSRPGADVETEWPSTDDHSLVSAISAPDQPEPAVFPERRLRPTAELVGVRPATWERLVVRADGRAHLEFSTGLPEQLAEIAVEHLGERILLTVLLGVERSALGESFAPIGIPSTAEVRLPVRIVDGSRSAHR